MVIHSSILAWTNPWTEESGGLQSMGSQKVGHDLVAKQQQVLADVCKTTEFTSCAQHRPL